MMLNRSDLNTIQGLLHYAGDALTDKDLDVEIKISDSNADVLGVIALVDDEYQFFPGDEPR